MICKAMSTFAIGPSPPLSDNHMKASYILPEIDHEMTAIAPLALGALFEAALKSRMYSGYAPCVAVPCETPWT